MVPSLEYLCRNIIIEKSIIKLSANGIRRFSTTGDKEIMDQYMKVIKEKMPGVSYARINDNQAIIITDFEYCHMKISNRFQAITSSFT